MRVTIEPSVAKGMAFAPPSKSYAHRMLICAALSRKESSVYKIAKSEDMYATLDCIKALGINYIYQRGKVCFYSNNDTEFELRKFNCRESGSTLRFFIPIALALGGVCEFSGTERLISRGISVYDDICRKQNIEVKYSKDKITFNGKLKSGDFEIRGDISSQFITGLFFALPLLNGDSTVKITTPLESRPYVDITIDTLSRFGVKIEEKKKNEFYIKGNQEYIPMPARVEGDFSNAAFLDAFNVLGGDVSVKGLRYDSLQGDRAYLELFREIKNGRVCADISSCPDLAPILFALSGVKNGGYFTGTRRLRIKESDRAEAMAEELKKFGIDVLVDENSVEVKKSHFHAPNEALDGHNDHRIVMALSVIAALTGATIDGAQAVAKSFPTFFEVIQRLGIKVRKNEVR
ncbi:MAG: 3-phosphoshikimate 1-carboxyvinyltransferase [Clostridia bacterium]|nr:3-phosphoshikimate 1-carboxyvinyltransferase [Clostridia bacterium]